MQVMEYLKMKDNKTKEELNRELATLRRRVRELTKRDAQRQQVDESLKDSRRRFRDLVNLLPQSVWEIDTAGNFTFVNQAGFTFHGYDIDEFRGADSREPLNCTQSFIPEDRERLWENTKRVLKGEELGGTEYTALRKDGSTFPVVVYSAPIMRENEAVGVRGVTIDITEQKQMEEALRESKKRYLDLVNMLPQTIWETDEKGRLTFASRHGTRMYGYTLEDTNKGLSIFQMFAPEEHERVKENFQRILNSEDLGGTEYTVLRKDGSTFPGLIFSAPIIHEGKAVGLRGVTLNISRIKHAEANSKAQKELIDRILASTLNSVLVIDKQYQVILANEEFCSTFNIVEKDVVSRRIDEVIRIEGLSGAIRNTFSNRQAQPDLEFRYKINNIERILATSIIPMQHEEILLVFRDITEERARQERLYLTDRLASIGEMAAGIAHELNNPLAGVVALSQLLVESDLPDEIRDDVQDIYCEAQRAAKIVRNLLSFSRRSESAKQLTQINDAIEDILRLRAYEQKVNDIQVLTHLDPSLPEVIVDYFQMQQVFLNIILNAENAITDKNKHGKLVIATERVNGTIKASFTDDGPGIPKENLSRIFDPFFTTKEVGQGTGLGLSICYGIVADHGGRLYAESEVGKGTTFTVEIPVNTQ
jgi:PAS domain S-box-containing protein